MTTIYESFSHVQFDDSHLTLNNIIQTSEGFGAVIRHAGGNLILFNDNVTGSISDIGYNMIGGFVS